jgi:hypothetical protein
LALGAALPATVRWRVDAHRTEVRDFAEVVTGDEVVFHACAYRELLAAWGGGSSDAVRAHAATIAARFDI